MRAGVMVGMRWWLKAAGRRLVAVLGLLPCLAGPATAQVCVAVDSHNAPFMFSRGDVAEGLYPALVRAAFQQMQQPVRLEAVPWSRALRQIDEAECGVAGIYKNRERMQKYDFSAPIFVERVRLYARRERGLTFGTAQGLAGLRIGVIRGWSYGDAFDGLRRAGVLRAEEVASDAQNFSKLESGRLDAALAVEQAGTALLAGGAYPSVQALPQPLAVNATHLAFHRTAKMGPLLKRFDDAIDRLRRDGTHDRLVAQALLTQ